MNLTPKISFLLLICVLFVLFFGVWGKKALLGCGPTEEQNQKQKEFTRQKRGLQDFRSHIRRFRMRSDKNEEKNNEQEDLTHINIQVTNLEEEERKDQQKDQQIKQALLKMMNKKLKETKVASKQRRHFDNAPGLDFRREFASDEPNPYIENLRNRCEQA
ncbi:hypothetical protein ACLKA6_017670 [Drosophila palustris]